MNPFSPPKDLPYQTLKIDEFVRSIEVSRFEPHGLLIGAGASISSGVPAAGACIWEWKRRIFLSNNPGLEDFVREISLGSVQNRIQKWLDNQRRWPRQGDNDEYQTYIRACFPASASDRRKYFQELCRSAKPHTGYHFLSVLAQSGIVKTVWTTNFDGLTVRVAQSESIDVIECGLDTPERVVRPPHNNEFVHIALHGDYRYDDLKNTSEELQNQDKIFRDDLIQRLYDNHLIVCGYSGRDNSVMEALKTAYSTLGPAGRPAPGRLFWCSPHEPPINADDPVFELLALAKQHNREAYYIQVESFDDVMRRLALACVKDDPAQIQKIKSLNETAPETIEVAPFELEKGEGLEILRSNAFPIEIPMSFWEFTSKNLNEQRWKHIRQITEGHDVVAVPYSDKIFALGEPNEIREIFAPFIEGNIQQGNVTDDDLNNLKSVVVEMLTRAITLGLTHNTDFQCNGKGLIWHTNYQVKIVMNQRCHVHEAVFLALRRYANKLYLVVEPTVVANDVNGERLPKDIEQELKRQVLSGQRNPQYVSKVNSWKKLLFGEQVSFSFSYPADSSNGADFVLQTRSALALVHRLPQTSEEEPQPEFSLPPGLSRLVTSTGVRVDEPKLVFTAKTGKGFTYDAYPLRGILRNRPYDYHLSERQNENSIRVGAVCPNSLSDQRAAGRYLVQFQHPAKVAANQEYVLDYPGFESAFGVPLSLPLPDGTAWSYYETPQNRGNLLNQATQLKNSIIEAIDRLIENYEVDIVVIYVPTHCEQYTEIFSDGISFDLRRLVKAYCIEREVASQFLKDKTVLGPDNMRCQSLWWLALAFYVKAGRTPYILAGLNSEAGLDETAFAGLGFSQDHGGAKGKHITIGCSHIYSSQGVDLKYKLSGLNSVFWKNRNPFLTRSDARRVGEGVRELFFEARGKLPRRVVLHKRTPFGNEETKGLIEGLHGVEQIDLLEVTVEPELRFMTQVEDQGKLSAARFPVSRDTVLQLDSRHALLWVHGTVPSIRQGLNYYMGGFRIPAPLMLHRAYGSTPLAILSHELLGLSKMNWNTFGMYTKAPATIQSSNDIAKIGALLGRFGSVSYDYRLFI